MKLYPTFLRYTVSVVSKIFDLDFARGPLWENARQRTAQGSDFRKKNNERSERMSGRP